MRFFQKKKQKGARSGNEEKRRIFLFEKQNYHFNRGSSLNVSQIRASDSIFVPIINKAMAEQRVEILLQANLLKQGDEL